MQWILPVFGPSSRCLAHSTDPGLWPQLSWEARRWLADAMVRVCPVTWSTVEIIDNDEHWLADFARIANAINGERGKAKSLG
jgi:hypothetical protein